MKKQMSNQGELVENPNDRDPFRKKQQIAISGTHSISQIIEAELS